MNYPDIMVDLETTGTSPDENAIIQIAAVRFNLREGTVSPHVFDQALLLPPTRYWDEDTRRWWSNKKEVFQSIYARARPPRMVVDAFAKWVREGVSDPVFWAKPISFDYPFMQSYFREFEVSNPFHFRMAENMNTFIRARHFPDRPPAYEKEIPFDGDEHNGIDDCFHQIKVLFAAYEATQ